MKNLTLSIAVLLFSISNFAQDAIELTPTYGWHFGGKAYYYEGDIKIDDNHSYGVILSLPIDWDVRGEFSWSRSDSKAHFRAIRPGLQNRDFDVASNYFLLSGIKSVGSDKFKGFGGGALGAAWLDAKEPGVSDVWRFSFALQAGAKLYLSDLIGLRFQGRLLVPLHFQGGGIFCGIGTGGSNCGVSIGSTSAIVQGDLSVGLIFQLGELY